MTKGELMRAFEMRIDGASYEEIGRALHYSLSGIKRALENAIHNGRSWNKTIGKIVYPAVVDYMLENDLTVTGMYHAAYAHGDGMDSAPGWFYDALYGVTRPSDRVAAPLTALLGKSYSEVFRREADGECPEALLERGCRA